MFDQHVLIPAFFILITFILSGVVHVLWLSHPLSERFSAPVDGGRTFRDRRIFGDNKKMRGFMIMPPAAALTFYLFAQMRSALPDWYAEGLWSMSDGRFALLGLIAGCCFMLGELPNSFIKRQFGIESGQAAEQPLCRIIAAVADRLDSIIGTLIGISLFVPLPLMSCVYVVLLGPGLHLLFSAFLFYTKVKERVA
jgi:hypothetical protein